MTATIDEVIFRVSDDDGSVFALFPYIPATDRYVTSYQHIGQHCAADYNGCIADSRPAKPEEYAALLQELRDRDYNPRVIVRASRRRMLDAFAASL